MGYTNYWHQHNDFTDDQWKEIKEEYEYVKEVYSMVKMKTDMKHF